MPDNVSPLPRLPQDRQMQLGSLPAPAPPRPVAVMQHDRDLQLRQRLAQPFQARPDVRVAMAAAVFLVRQLLLAARAGANPVVVVDGGVVAFPVRQPLELDDEIELAQRARRLQPPADATERSLARDVIRAPSAAVDVTLNRAPSAPLIRRDDRLSLHRLGAEQRGQQPRRRGPDAVLQPAQQQRVPQALAVSAQRRVDVQAAQVPDVARADGVEEGLQDEPLRARRVGLGEAELVAAVEDGCDFGVESVVEAHPGEVGAECGILVWGAGRVGGEDVDRVGEEEEVLPDHDAHVGVKVHEAGAHLWGLGGV